MQRSPCLVGVFQVTDTEPHLQDPCWQGRLLMHDALSAIVTPPSIHHREPTIYVYISRASSAVVWSRWALPAVNTRGPPIHLFHVDAHHRAAPSPFLLLAHHSIFLSWLRVGSSDSTDINTRSPVGGHVPPSVHTSASISQG